MFRRRLIIFCIGATLTAAAVVWRLDFTPNSGIHYAAYARIEMDMPQAEVEAILGGAPRDELGPRTICSSGLRPIGGEMKTWYGKTADIRVGFDDNHVIWKDYTRRTPRRLWETTLRCFGLPLPEMWDCVQKPGRSVAIHANHEFPREFKPH